MQTERPMSFSSYQAMNLCGRKYYITYVLGLESKKLSINLGFGKVVDEFTSNYLSGLCLGKYHDPVKMLDDSWHNTVVGKKWDWGKTFTQDEYYFMAKSFADQLPERWKQSGLQVLKSTDGKPLVQWRVFHDIGGIRCHSVIDTVVYNPANDVVGPVDIKTTTAKTPQEWMPLSEQLGFYVHALNSDPRIPFDNVTHGGFWEFFKRKPNMPKSDRKKPLKGPQIEPASVFELDPSNLAELPKRIAITKNRIARREFMGQPRMAFNTPCIMCDFSEYCLKGDKSILRKRKAPAQQVIARQPA